MKITVTCSLNVEEDDNDNYDEDYAIPQDIIQEMEETYHKMHTEIARGK